nr:hypothetical protein [Wolbachia endosymbiont of Wuchereria bancrofti]
MSDSLMVKDYKKGRRKRLREKIVLDNRQSLLNYYEVLEHILHLTYSRIDVKPVAKSLIENFSSLKRICL